MENLIISQSDKNPFVPVVSFDADTGICSMAGESYLEDSAKFYQGLIAWLQQYMNQKQGRIQFDIKLTYFNTSSSKGILDILQNLKQYQQKGKNVEINWYYPKNDTDNLEDARDYMEDAGVVMNLIAY